MYSLVLMMAMSGTAADVPAFGKRGHDCHGGGYSSCYGGGYGSCHGGGYSSCYGGGSGSCYGGGYTCHGGYGGCSGSCHGGRGGLFGRRHHHESCGCCGGGYGGGYSSCYGGGYGGCMGSGYGCMGSGYGCMGSPVIVGGTTTGTVTGTEVKPKGTGGKDGDVMLSAPATIVVTLPANATLTVDGSATTSVGGTRRLVTPALPVGQTFAYTLKAKVGDAVASKRIEVRGGEETALILAPGKTVVQK